MLTPGAFSGTAQVIDSFSAPGATGCRLPHQVSWQNTVAVPSIFRPLMVTPASSSSTTRRVGGVRFSASFGFGHPPALRIGHGVRGENVVRPHVPVVLLDVVAEALADALEHRRVHDEPAHIAREIVGRAAEQPMRPRRDAPVRLEPLVQVLARARQQEIAGESLAVLLRRSSRRGSPARASCHRSWRTISPHCETPDARSRRRPVRGRHRPCARRECFRDIPRRSAALSPAFRRSPCARNDSRCPPNASTAMSHGSRCRAKLRAG